MTAETFKLVFVVALAVSLMAIGMISFKRKPLVVGFGGRATARPLFTLTLKQMGASIFGLTSVVGSAIIFVLVVVATFTIDVISVDSILSVAVTVAFVTVVGGFTFATVIQIAKNAGDLIANNQKSKEN